MSRALQRLMARDRRERLHGWIAGVCASALHAAAAFAMSTEQPLQSLPQITQVTLDTRPPLAQPEPVPEPPVAEEQPRPEPKPVRAQRPVAEKPSPPIARPAALLTAPESTQSPATPVRFAADPTNTAQSYGLVARGASAPAQARAAPTPVPTSEPTEALVPADRLSRPPRLPTADACRADFPARAHSDHAEVQLIAVVHASGTLASVRIESELPKDEGFANAARACVLRQRFESALDRESRAVAASARITIRFAR